VMLTKAYEHRNQCKALQGLVKLFLVWNLISIIIWCSGTYLLYIRIWNKALEWVKKREAEAEGMGQERRPEKNYEDKSKSPSKYHEDEEESFITNDNSHEKESKPVNNEQHVEVDISTKKNVKEEQEEIEMI